MTELTRDEIADWLDRSAEITEYLEGQMAILMGRSKYTYTFEYGSENSVTFREHHYGGDSDTSEASLQDLLNASPELARQRAAEAKAAHAREVERIRQRQLEAELQRARELIARHEANTSTS